MIFVREIRKSFGRVEAVRGVSFAVQPGEIVGLLGPNGAGKSTTIRVIAGYLTPDGGAVQIDGFDTQTHSLQARRRIGYLPESAPVYPEMSVAGYLDYRARLFGLDRAARRRALGTALDRCRIADVARRRVGDLSKGYRQRVGLASALLHDPPVLILDEPSNGLDPSQIRETRSLVKDLAEKRTMIVSSHILPEVERLATRLVVIAGGRKRADGDLRELLSRQTTRTLVAEVQDHSGAFGATVGATRGVQRVERADAGAPGWVRLTIEVLPSAPDPRPEIARQAAAAGVALRELREERPSIERLFLELVESGDGQADPA
jgi:ABC-2 type transport system ATP-binding protein